MNTLIERIRRNTDKRKRIKKRIDSELNLSVENDADVLCLSAGGYSNEANRLIDEGAIIEGDGSVWAYIKKGTLAKFMNRENVYLDNLPEDFVGNIDIGHFDHATFPFPVGEWQMSDMRLVDIGEGRQGIDIDVTLDEESMFIKELKRLGHPISMSIEALFHLDWEATEDLGIPIIDELLIFAYAVVGDGKNVNSNGLELKGESKMTKEQLAELKAKMKSPETEEAGLSAEVTEEEIEETELNAEEATDTEEAELSAEEDPEEEVEEAELSASEEADGEEDAEEDIEEAESEEAAYEEVEAYITDLQEQVASLSAENAELKKTNNRLQKKLKAELSKKEEFVSKFASVAESMGVTEPPEKNKVSDYVFGDGIGE